MLTSRLLMVVRRRHCAGLLFSLSAVALVIVTLPYLRDASATPDEDQLCQGVQRADGFAATPPAVGELLPQLAPCIVTIVHHPGVPSTVVVARNTSSRSPPSSSLRS